jgi:hypothetical protein
VTDHGRPDADRPDPEPEVRRRVPWSPWWRPVATVAVVGALTWGVTTSDAALRLGGDAVSDGTGAGAGLAADTFVEAALLACPGLVPRSDGGSAQRPRVAVLAAGAPQSVQDAVPPPTGDDSAGSTADPEQTTATSPPRDPEEGTATAPPPDGASVLTAADAGGEPVELRHGTPAGYELRGAGPAVVDAAGGLAPGVAGGQLGLGAEPGSRGLTVSACVPPAEEQWLVGGGSAPGRSEQLVLTNPGPDAVTVEVLVWGTDGPVGTTGASGIVVPGGDQVVELLDGLAPAADAPVVAVSASGGPVVAHLAESFREGTTDRGTEVMSPVAAPATDLVVPALPPVPDGHEHRVVLRVAAPGAQAVVDVTALTADGAVRLTDRVTRVRGGHTVDVDLGDLPEGATALRLRSDEPVVAGARLEVLPAEDEPEVVEQTAPQEDPDGEGADEDARDGTDQGEPLLRAAGDVAWVGASVPATTPTGLALPGRGAVPGAGTALAVSAVDGTTARVTWVDEEGTETVRSLTLPNDTTTVVDLPEEARAVWVSADGAAGVVTALHVTGADGRGPYLASTTLPQLPWLRQVTQVRPLVP